MFVDLISKIKKNQSSFKIPVSNNDKSEQFLLEFENLSLNEKELFLKDDEIIDGFKNSYIFGSFYFIKSLVKSGIFYRESEEEKEIINHIDELEKENMKLWTIDMFFNGPTYKNVKALYDMDKVNILKDYYANVKNVPYVDKFKNRELYYNIFIALAKVAEKHDEYKNIVFAEAIRLKENKIIELLENIKKSVPEIDFRNYSLSSTLKIYDLDSKAPLNKVFFKALMMIGKYGFKNCFNPEDVLRELSKIEGRAKQPRISKLTLNNGNLNNLSNIYDLKTSFNSWINSLNLTYKDLENLIKIIEKSNINIQEYLEPVETCLTEKIMKFENEKNKLKNVVFKVNKF